MTKIIFLLFFTCSAPGCNTINNDTQIDLPQVNNVRTNKKIEFQKIEDIQYENDCNECKLDIYKKNDNTKSKPIIIFVHGGGWKMGSKTSHTQKGEFFAKNNYLFITIEYPLFPKVDYTEQTQKIAQAIKWTYDNAEKYNGNKDNITLMGHSAGGHLVALVSTDESYMQSLELELKNIRETILLDSAGLDILQVKQKAPVLFDQIYKPIFGDKPIDLQKASPINYITKNKGIPIFLIFYSTLNKSTTENAIIFNKKLINNNIKSEIHAIDTTHQDINKNIGNQNDEVTKAIMKHLKR